MSTTGTTEQATGPDHRERGRHTRSFWYLAYAFATMMAFSGAPAPLYVLYQRRDGFGSFTVTLIFAAYAVGVVVSLFLGGHVSDWVGRRRMLIPALLLNMTSGLIFLLPGLSALLIARFVSGVSIGILTATATAHLTELHFAARPGAPRRRADLVATAANIGGIGIGPLIAGLLAEYAPQPLVVPYVVFEVLLAVGLAGVLLAPETVSRRKVDYRPQRVSVPSTSRPRYAAACLAGFAAFAIFGLFTSLAPGFLAASLHLRSHALAGLVTFVVFAAGVTSQIVLSSAPLARQILVSLVTLVVGLVGLIVGMWTVSFALFLIGGVLTGAGAGPAFKSAVTSVLTLAAPSSRGEALAGLFLVSYLGLAVPVLGLGWATQHMQPRTALLGFAAALIVLLTAAVRPLLRDDN